MSPELEALMRAILADPPKMAALTPDQERRLMTDLETVVGQARREAPVPVPAAPAPAWSEADLLTVKEVAAILQSSPRWVYRHAKTLPFTRRLSRKMLRFSRLGLMRYLASKRL